MFSNGCQKHLFSSDSEDHLMKYGTAGQSVRWTQLAEEYNVKSVNMLLLS